MSANSGAAHGPVERSILALASVCDGAHDRDGAGFNGRDAEFGRSLAEQLQAGRTLSPRQYLAAAKMIRIYRRQLASMGIVLPDEASLTAAAPPARVAPTEAAPYVAPAARILTIKGEPRLAFPSPYAIKDETRALPGVRWEPKPVATWHLPATPAGAETLARFAKEQAIALEWTPEATALVEQAREQYRALHHRTAADAELPQTPTKLPGWSHQRQAFAFARELDAAMLAMDMGTGKSLTAIALLEEWNAFRVLVLCPVSVMNVWPREFGKHAVRPWSVEVLRGSSIKRAAHLRTALETSGPVCVVVNYESSWRDPLAQHLLAVDWDVVVCDESHRIKSPGAVSSKFAAKLSHHAKHRLCLTGTPMPHNPLDVYGQYRFLDAGVFGTSYAAFRNRYAIMGGFENKQVVGMRDAKGLAQRFGRLAYQCKAADVLDLPEALEVTRTCVLDKATRTAYQDLKEDFVAETEAGLLTAANAGVKVIRLQQVTSGMVPVENAETGEMTAYRIGTEKADLLRDVLGDLPADEPVVVFARFTADLDAIRDAAAAMGRTYAELSGRRRDALGDDACMAPGVQIAGVQIQAGGVGIDLTAARVAIYFSVGHSLGDYTQSLARLHRPGQTRNVLYVHLVAEKTIDGIVYRALASRKSVVDAVLVSAKENDE